MRRPNDSQLVELRNYKLRPGMASEFEDFFEEHLLESQEALGMDLVAHFRVLDEPDRFLWIRRFPEPDLRGELLERFYSGPVWKQFGPHANELMLEFDDVYLLMPDRSAPEFAAHHVPHAERGRTRGEPGSIVVAAIYEMSELGAIPPSMVDAMSLSLQRRPRAGELGRLVTAPLANDFPRLPVHGMNVALWLLSDDRGGDAAISAAVNVAQAGDWSVRTIRLSESPRSKLR